MRRLLLALPAVCLAGCLDTTPESNDPTVIAVAVPEPADVAVHDGHVFWTHQPERPTIGERDPGSVFTVPVTGGEPRAVATGTWHPSALAVDERRVYWLDQSSEAGGVPRLMSASRSGASAAPLIEALEDPPAAGTRLAVFEGRLYWGGAVGLYSVPVDGGEVERLVPGFDEVTGAMVLVHVDHTGLYWVEVNDILGRDLKRAPLEGVEEQRLPGRSADGGVSDGGDGDAGDVDAGSQDAGSAEASDAGAGDANAVDADAGELDGGALDGGGPGEDAQDAGAGDGGDEDAGSLDGGAPTSENDGNVLVLVSSDAVSSALHYAIVDGFVWWIANNILSLSAPMHRVSIEGGEQQRVFNYSSGGAPEQVTTDGDDVFFADTSATGNGVYVVVEEEGELGWRALHRGGIVGARPSQLRVTRDDIIFVGLTFGGANIHRIAREPVDAGASDAGDG